MNPRRSNEFFRPAPGTEFTITGLTGEMNTTFDDLNIEDHVLSAGQNMIPASETSLKKRGGIQLYNQFLGTNTGILGGFSFIYNGSQENLTVFDTGVYRDVSGSWTALTSVTMTTNKPAQIEFFPITGKFYIVNGTDNVVKFTPGLSSGDQTDGSFKKGKYIVQHKNRLLVSGVAGQTHYVWYTDLGVDTFSSNNYFIVPGEVTGLIELYDRLIIATERKLYMLQNFTFSGTAAGPEVVYPIPSDFGSIYQRTLRRVNNQVFFLGQDSQNVANMYMTNGYTVQSISDLKIRSTLNGLSATQLSNSCAGAKGVKYLLAVPESGQSTNTEILVYDTVFDKVYTPQFRLIKGIADFTCFWDIKTNSQWQVYAGTSGTGQVYQLDANDGLYDELPEERYLTAGAYNVPVDANPAKRAAQSFKLSNYTINDTVNINKVALLLKKNAGTTTQLTVRIETDNNGTPSGTLVTNASATIAAITSTSYAWQTVSFTTAPALTGNTTYWLVLEHTTEGSGNSQYFWLANTCTALYANGMTATYAPTSAFNVTYNPSSSTAIDGYVEYALNSPGTTFSGVRTQTTGYAAFPNSSTLSAALAADSSTTNNFTDMQRTYILFDTTSLPSNATITSASISLYITGKVNNLSQNMNIVSSAPGSNTTLTTSDYNLANFGSTRFITDVSLDSLTLNAYNSFTLNASGVANITKAGISKFGLRLSGDIDNTAPTWVAGKTSVVSMNSRLGSNAPRLVVNYTIAGSSNTWVSDPATDQNFIIYPQSAIDGIADTKAFKPNNGKQYQLQRFESIFSTTGNYSVEVGFSAGAFATFQNFYINLASTTTATWNNGVAKWNDGVTIWNGANARSFTWTDVYGFEGRTLKARIRNRKANQQFEFNQITTILTLRPRQI